MKPILRISVNEVKTMVLQSDNEFGKKLINFVQSFTFSGWQWQNNGRSA